MSKRTFLAKFGDALTPIRAGGGKVWYDRLQLDRLISRESGWSEDDHDQLKHDAEAYVRAQLEKRLR